MNQSVFVHALIDVHANIPPDICVGSGGNPRSRFNVYRNNVFVSLIEALQESYPVVSALVGEDFFREMAREYAIHFLPQSPVMALYGEDFPGFISQFESCDSLPYLPDIATLEWQRILSLHCADFNALQAHDFESLLSDPDGLQNIRLTLNPSVAVMNSKYALGSLWEAHQHVSHTEIVHRLSLVDPHVPETVLILRQGISLIMNRLSLADSVFISELSRQNTLGAANQKAEEISSQFDLAQLMGRLISYGAFVSTLTENEFR